MVGINSLSVYVWTDTMALIVYTNRNKTCGNDNLNYVGTYCLETNFYLIIVTHKKQARFFFALMNGNCVIILVIK